MYESKRACSVARPSPRITHDRALRFRKAWPLFRRDRLSCLVIALVNCACFEWRALPHSPSHCQTLRCDPLPPKSETPLEVMTSVCDICDVCQQWLGFFPHSLKATKYVEGIHPKSERKHLSTNLFGYTVPEKLGVSFHTLIVSASKSLGPIQLLEGPKRRGAVWRTKGELTHAMGGQP
ncbi:hypothetical protein J6590_004100 [Homalodisca vitripennis]|nr:hypothetical protein J6590_004100 [Homalodisca vitripennis]